MTTNIQYAEECYTAVDPTTLSETWNRYRTADAGSPTSRADRGVLIEHYAPLVGYVVGLVLHRLPSEVERDDLKQYGALGLINAVERFDPTKGVPFEAYARIRIRGAITDGLREADWAPRSVRHRARLLEAAHQDLLAALGRDPTVEELAEALGTSVDDVHHIVGDTKATFLTQLVKDDGTYMGDRVDHGGEDPQLEMELEGLAWLLAGRLAGLDEMNRCIAVLSIMERLSHTEIGLVVGVGDTRICQIFPKMMRSLKA